MFGVPRGSVSYTTQLVFLEWAQEMHHTVDCELKILGIDEVFDLYIEIERGDEREKRIHPA